MPERRQASSWVRFHGGPDAASEAREGGKESLGVVLLAEAGLQVDGDALELVDEGALLGDQVLEEVLYLFQALLQGFQLLFEIQVFVHEGGRRVHPAGLLVGCV
jgi:hypothetical protein